MFAMNVALQAIMGPIGAESFMGNPASLGKVMNLGVR